MEAARDYLLISDLDDTLLGDDEALRKFANFCASLEGARLHLVYSSGRFYGSIARDIERTALPEPLAVVGGVGTDIRKFPGGAMIDEWRSRMSRQWSADKLHEVLSGESGLELQPEKNQSDFKVSYYAENASEQQLREWREKLERAGIRATLVYSSSRDLDFLPAGVDKGTAARFVADWLGFPAERTMVAGNSANDSALFEHGFLGIVVSNAHDALKRYATKKQVYLASAEVAAGVQEGVRHWLRKIQGKPVTDR